MGFLSDEQAIRVVDLAMDLARQGRTTDLVEFFDHGLPVDAQDSDGNTALMLAAYHGRLDTVRTLIQMGADPDLTNNRDQTPIAGAIFKGEDQVVGALRDAGADLDRGTPTARATAEMFGRTHLLAGPAD